MANEALTAIAARQALRGATVCKGRSVRPDPSGRRASRGARIVSWEIDDSAFVADPLLSNGHKGPGLHLRSMFEIYNQQVDASDATAEFDVAAASRARNEAEAEVSRWATR